MANKIGTWMSLPAVKARGRFQVFQGLPKSSAVCGRWPLQVRSDFGPFPRTSNDASIFVDRNRWPCAKDALGAGYDFGPDKVGTLVTFFLGKKVTTTHVLPNLLSSSSVETRIIIGRPCGQTYGICVATNCRMSARISDSWS